LGEQREFCCHGCKAVCEAIVDAGLEDYYRTRDAHPAAQQQNLQQQILQKLAVYDNPKVQQSFVHSTENWQEAYLILEGIRCSACIWLNELHLRKQPGVIDVHIDDITQRARVRWNPQHINLSDILASIVAIGYQAHPYEPSHYLQLQRANKRKNLKKILYAAIIGMIPMQFSLASWLIGGPAESGNLEGWEQAGRWISMLLTLSVLVYSGQDFFYGLWSDLRRRVIGMDVPIVIGLCGAYLLSVYSTFKGSGEVYYESIIMFVLFILFSRRLEQRARVQASDRLERLALAQPGEAERIVDDGSIERVAVLELQQGDLIRILPGERVPVDCEIVEGASSFDESLISGESRAIGHGAGERLMAGSVNFDQPVQARVSASEMDSTIASITRLAESGLQHKPEQSLLADRVAARFVVFILFAAVVTAIFWWLQGNPQWAVYAVSVLIVTCPCALALAAPIALTLASNRFLQQGVLAVNLSVLGKLAQLDVFVFDKTGTLTEGKPQLVQTLWSEVIGLSVDQAFARNVLDALARQSEHPLAKALRIADAKPVIELCRVENHIGEGISAQLEAAGQAQSWRLGSIVFTRKFVDFDVHEQVLVDMALQSGMTVSCLSRDDRLLALLLFEDRLRAGNKQVIEWLLGQGIRPVILSGDACQPVRKLALELGIEAFQADLSPQQKMRWVHERQQAGERVAMVGDGINDAPTLACADVSFSLSESTSLANVHSDFLLLKHDLKGIPASIRLTRRTLRLIRQNFAWAILYNLLAIPFAMAGWVPPWAAAIGMSASSIIVVVNSMRLKKAAK
jgi:Cu2+-exporting ATPase